MENVGRSIIISLWSGETVEGWVFGRTTLGIHVALDREASNIRFVPDTLISGYSFDHKGRVSFPHQIDSEACESLQNQLERPLSQALDRVDHNRIKRMVRHYRHLSWSLRDRMYPVDSNDYVYPRFPWAERFSELALEARGAHGALLDELSRSGVRDILLERREQIRAILSRSTLPAIESAFLPLSEIDEAIAFAREHDNLAETDLGAKPLSRISPRDIIATFEAPEEAPLDESETQVEDDIDARAPTPPDVTKPRRGRKLRAVSAWLKVAAGGGLAASNIAIGAVVGVASAIPTLGMGTVGGAVAIAASTATGISMAADGLDKVGTLQGEQ